MMYIFYVWNNSYCIFRPLLDPKINATGIWNLEYTTSDTVLGRGDIFERTGDILQVINTKELTAENRETLNIFGIKLPRKVTAELSPMSKTQVAVKFKKFYIGSIPITAPPNAVGTLDVTYLDKDMRISRGDKGGVFVLTR